MDAMRAAWRDNADLREAVRERQRERFGTPASFAEIAFGERGEKRGPVDADAVHRQLREAQD